MNLLGLAQGYREERGGTIRCPGPVVKSCVYVRSCDRANATPLKEGQDDSFEIGTTDPECPRLPDVFHEEHDDLGHTFKRGIGSDPVGSGEGNDSPYHKGSGGFQS